MITRILTLGILLAFTSCEQSSKTEPILSVLDNAEIHPSTASDLKTFHLSSGFKTIMGQEEVLGALKTYTYMQLLRNNAIIYVDSSLTEYEFRNALFPMVLQTGENSFEILFEINDRPNKNYLKRFFVHNDTLTGQDKLPVFEGKAKDINHDGIQEYAGYWDGSELLGENYLLSYYNPILYYSLTNTGLKLDSSLTKQRNEIIYGKFHGYLLDENLTFSKEVIASFNQELEHFAK